MISFTEWGGQPLGIVFYSDYLSSWMLVLTLVTCAIAAWATPRERKSILAYTLAAFVICLSRDVIIHLLAWTLLLTLAKSDERRKLPSFLNWLAIAIASLFAWRFGGNRLLMSELISVLRNNHQPLIKNVVFLGFTVGALGLAGVFPFEQSAPRGPRSQLLRTIALFGLLRLSPFFRLTPLETLYWTLGVLLIGALHTAASRQHSRAQISYQQWQIDCTAADVPIAIVLGVMGWQWGDRNLIALAFPAAILSLSLSMLSVVAMQTTRTPRMHLANALTFSAVFPFAGVWPALFILACFFSHSMAASGGVVWFQFGAIYLAAFTIRSYRSPIAQIQSLGAPSEWIAPAITLASGWLGIFLIHWYGPSAGQMMGFEYPNNGLTGPYWTSAEDLLRLTSSTPAFVIEIAAGTAWFQYWFLKKGARSPARDLISFACAFTALIQFAPIDAINPHWQPVLSFYWDFLVAPILLISSTFFSPQSGTSRALALSFDSVRLLLLAWAGGLGLGRSIQGISEIEAGQALFWPITATIAIEALLGVIRKRTQSQRIPRLATITAVSRAAFWIFIALKLHR